MSKKEDYSKTEVKFYYIGYPMTCGKIPNDKAYEYLDKLKASANKTKQCTHYSFSLPCQVYVIPGGTVTVQSLHIYANQFSLVPLCRVRTKAGCLRNIKSGKCRDPFIVENIGKVFFADKYQDDNQR